MAKRNRILNDKGALEAQGCNVDGKTCGVSGVKLFTTNMTRLADYLRDIDSMQYLMRYKWRGLPKNLPAWRLEQMLYYRGSLACFKTGKDFFILPYANTSGINLIGLPNAITPVSFNGAKPEEEGERFMGDKALIINNSGEYNPDAEAVILYDRFNGMINCTGISARFAMSECIINEMCNRFAYLGINIRNSQGKYLIICKDEKTADVITRQLDELYNSTKSFALIRTMFDVQVINDKVDYQEQQIWEDIASWNSLRLEGLGISHNGLFNKKERQINGELTGAREQTSSVLQDGLLARQIFVEQVKELFGDDPDFKEQFGTDFGVELAEQLQETSSNEDYNETLGGKKDVNN